jgi:hypothetical protein
MLNFRKLLISLVIRFLKLKHHLLCTCKKAAALPVSSRWSCFERQQWSLQWVGVRRLSALGGPLSGPVGPCGPWPLLELGGGAGARRASALWRCRAGVWWPLRGGDAGWWPLVGEALLLQLACWRASEAHEDAGAGFGRGLAGHLPW